MLQGKVLSRLSEIKSTPLNIFPLDSGPVMHGLKMSDDAFDGFGEVYFSFIKLGAIKAWKLHEEMTLNLVVPVGNVKFVFCSPDEKSVFRVDEIGQKNYIRLTVPPGIWFGFKGLSVTDSLVVNIANIPHNDAEVERKEINYLRYKW